MMMMSSTTTTLRVVVVRATRTTNSNACAAFVGKRVFHRHGQLRPERRAVSYWTRTTTSTMSRASSSRDDDNNNNNRRIDSMNPSFLLGALSRAERTLTTRINHDNNGEDDDNTDDSTNAPLIRELRDTLGEMQTNIPNPPKTTEEKKTQQPTSRQQILNNPQQPQETTDTNPPPTTLIQPTTTTISDNNDFNLFYGLNPTVTSTALAHHLWRHVLRPGVDSVIDATAGNGGDTQLLARLLFPPKRDNNTCYTAETTKSRLVAVDIQHEACQRTREKLASVLSEAELSSSLVKIVHGSHAPLPLPDDYNTDNSIALVVYNLGYLPSSSKEYLTQTHSTLASLTDAVRVLRVGGLLSVMTYPRSNHQEDWACHVFLEGLALFSSNTQDWRDFVDELPVPRAVVQQEEDEQAATAKEESTLTTRQLVRNALQQLWDERCLLPKKERRTWRVHEHRKLGWTDAPILLTAVRIK
mmetsp:Transcript_26229/g.72374  ORF Transcript_26229/g.72374 Transcript_26229/m.72374 type:complete len:470 (+) Transcript_26229:147-1556(+)